MVADMWGTVREIYQTYIFVLDGAGCNCVGTVGDRGAASNCVWIEKNSGKKA